MTKDSKVLNDDMQSRRWFFTINNEEKTDSEFFDYVKSLEHVKYFIFQREAGEKEETPHIQMFLIFSIDKRFSTIKKLFPRAHIEQVKGTNAQARDYCSKIETRVSGPFEYGEFAEERSRSDVKGFLELAKNGADSRSLSKLYPSLYLRELNKVEKIRQDELYEIYRRKLRDIEVTYIYGPPGSGKTKYIVEKFGLGNYYDVPFYNSSSFDQYKGEDVVVFDEFCSSFKITLMNKLIDRYPVQLPARYTNKMACYTKVYIVSNLPLCCQYRYEQETDRTLFDAFKRRIHNIIKIGYNSITYELVNGLIPLDKQLTIWESENENNK